MTQPAAEQPLEDQVNPWDLVKTILATHDTMLGQYKATLSGLSKSTCPKIVRQMQTHHDRLETLTRLIRERMPADA